MIANSYDQRMQLVVMLSERAASRAAHARNRMTWIRSHIFYGERPNFRTADGVLNHGANFLVTSFLADDSVAKQHTAGVGVDDKDRVVAGIKQDGVSGFRTHAGELQQLCSKFFSRLCEHAAERTRILVVEERDESLEVARFLAEVA